MTSRQSAAGRWRGRPPPPPPRGAPPTPPAEGQDAGQGGLSKPAGSSGLLQQPQQPVSWLQLNERIVTWYPCSPLTRSPCTRVLECGCCCTSSTWAAACREEGTLDRISHVGRHAFSIRACAVRAAHASTCKTSPGALHLSGRTAPAGAAAHLAHQRLAPGQRGAQQAQRLAGTGGRLQQRVLALQLWRNQGGLVCGGGMGAAARHKDGSSTDPGARLQRWQASAAEQAKPGAPAAAR